MSLEKLQTCCEIEVHLLFYLLCIKMLRGHCIDIMVTQCIPQLMHHFVHFRCLPDRHNNYHRCQQNNKEFSIKVLIYSALQYILYIYPLRLLTKSGATNSIQRSHS